MNKKSDNRIYLTVENVERVEYSCKCGEGYYRFDPDSERMGKHNQLPHRCTKCKELVYFTLPYPALRYKGRIFADWGTVRSLG